jgi:hypothetical protein
MPCVCPPFVGEYAGLSFHYFERTRGSDMNKKGSDATQTIIAVLALIATVVAAYIGYIGPVFRTLSRAIAAQIGDRQAP